ncbi:MAG: hypothetical protein AAB019_01255 [Planctomycetota bacterium]
MEKKWFLLVTGFFLGGLFVVAGMFMAQQLLIAQVPAANVNSGASGDFIALSSNDSKGHTLLWVLDTRNKKLVLYDYDATNVIFSWARDVQYDLNIPEGQVYLGKGANRSPFDIKKLFGEWQEKLDDSKNPK